MTWSLDNYVTGVDISASVPFAFVVLASIRIIIFRFSTMVLRVILRRKVKNKRLASINRTLG